MRFLASILALLFLQLSLLPGEMCAGNNSTDMLVCQSTCTNACNDTSADPTSAPQDDCHCNPLQACGQCALPMPSPPLYWNTIHQPVSLSTMEHISEAPKEIVLDFWQPPKLV